MAAPKTIEVVVLEPVLHDGVLHAPGESFSLPVPAAEALIAMGAARLPGSADTGT